MKRVAIVGVGCIPVGKHEEGLGSMFAQAARHALEDAALDRVEGLYVGNMLSGYLQAQENLGALSATTLGLEGVSAFKVEGACASGGVAVSAGFSAIRAGMIDAALVGGVEKMSANSTPEVTKALMMAEDRSQVGQTGISFVGLNAMIARRYMHDFHVSHDRIAEFPVLCHKHALENPYAQFRKTITVDDVLHSPLVADPLRLYDCSAIGDGAAALVLADMETARKLTDSPIEIAGSAVATDTISLHKRTSLTSFRAARASAAKAFDMAGAAVKDIDVLEVHDAFSILGVMALEDLGFAEAGKGSDLLSQGQLEVDGDLPTNTFGGLKARGHPVGASGAYQMVELAWQLREEAGKNQVKGAELGYAQSIGGIGSTVTGHVLKRSD